LKTKASEEHHTRQSQVLFLRVIPVIAPPDENPVAVAAGDPVIADGHLVSISARVFLNPEHKRLVDQYIFTKFTEKCHYPVPEFTR
jgi:hypothetical protein